MSDFRINGKGYVRSGNSTPEMSPVSEDGQMFSVSIILEPLENEISGVGGVPGKSSAINLVGLNVDNSRNGEMLQDDETKVAFVNTNKIEV